VSAEGDNRPAPPPTTRVPDSPSTVPVLLNATLMLVVPVLPVCLRSVPLLVNVCPVPAWRTKPPYALPASSVISKTLLLMKAAPLSMSTLVPSPFIVPLPPPRTRLRPLRNLLLRPPVMLIPPFAVTMPLPLIVPALQLSAPLSTTSPLPPSVPPPSERLLTATSAERFTVPALITTSSVVTGTPEGLQLLATNQSPVPPSHSLVSAYTGLTVERCSTTRAASDNARARQDDCRAVGARTLRAICENI
jgi:hypothetical protein